MSKDWSIRKRRPVRRKHIAPLLKALEQSLGIDLSVDGAFLEMAKWVEVDHGAIPFLMNGADCMVAGVQAADETIEKGELVWIRDMTHKKPLAIGWSIMAGSEMAEASKGKGIKTLHWFGDELWEMEP